METSNKMKIKNIVLNKQKMDGTADDFNRRQFSVSEKFEFLSNPIKYMSGFSSNFYLIATINFNSSYDHLSSYDFLVFGKTANKRILQLTCAIRI